MVNHAPSALGVPRLSDRTQRAALSRLIVAARDEGLALSEAARFVEGEAPRRRLLEQALRREALQRDWAPDFAEVGGVSSRSPSFGARRRALQRAVARLLAGVHQGDAYDVCARAAQRTSEAYARLASGMPQGAVRQRVEHERREVDRDCERLRRLRWGARGDAP